MEFKQAKRMENVALSGIRIVANKCMKLESEGKKVIAFTMGEPDFKTPKYIIEAAKKAMDDGKTKYPPIEGIPALKKAISERYKKLGGVSYDPQEILVTTGAAQAMFLSMMCWLNPGDEVIVPDPGYNSYTTIPHIAGAVMKKYNLLEENEFQIDIEEIKGLITEKTKMLVLISPNNPLGSSLKKETVEALAEMLRDKKLLVISDEIYDRLSYEEEAPVSIASYPGMKEKTIVINGFSKYYAMTGWRLGWAAAPKELLEPMARLLFQTTAGAVSFVEEAAVAALEEEDSSCMEMVEEFKKRRDYLVEEINKIDKLSCLRPRGAFYVFMNIKKTGMSSAEFADFLLDKCCVAVVPGTVFGDNGEGYVRLSYANSMENIKEAMKRIRAAMEEL